MNQLLSRLSTTATHMIRTDHAHVMGTFHEYEVDAPPRTKRALADSVCMALEMHAQLEEEIFYPAMRAIADTEFVNKSVPEHQQMRELIAQLPGLLAAGGDGAPQLHAHLQAARPILEAAASSNAEEWKAWAERLIRPGTMGQPTDLRAVLSALTDTPLGRQRAAVDPRNVSGVVDRLQESIARLGSTSDQPPEEWRPVLRALMGMTEADQPVDLNALLEHLASIAKPGSPATGSGKS